MKSRPKTKQRKAPRRAKPIAEARGVATYTKLLDVAEKLFAERGFLGVSLREIILEADVNIAAAHYHFGSKERLFEEVFARAAKPVCDLSNQMLDAAQEWVGREEYLEQLIKAHIVPTFRGSGNGARSVRNYNRLRAHIIVQDRGFAQAILKKTHGEVTRRIMAGLQYALPHLSQKALEWRFHILLVAGLFSAIPAGRVHALETYEPDDADEAIAFLVPQIAAAFRAPAGNGSDKRMAAPAFPQAAVSK